MIALLDTNALYWWLDNPDRLGEEAQRTITNHSNSIVVSAVVAWELAIKTNLGKLKAQPLLEIWDVKLAEEGFTELAIDSAHAIRAGFLTRHHHHKDPFDRMLAAQALVNGWPILSADRVFETYGVRRIW